MGEPSFLLVELNEHAKMATAFKRQAWPHPHPPLACWLHRQAKVESNFDSRQ